jgi:hypothetical protein
LWPLNNASFNPSQAAQERQRNQIASYLREKQFFLLPFLEMGLFDSFRAWLYDHSKQDRNYRGKLHHNNIFFKAKVYKVGTSEMHEALIPYGATYLEFYETLMSVFPSERDMWLGQFFYHFADGQDPKYAEKLWSRDFPLKTAIQNILL